MILLQATTNDTLSNVNHYESIKDFLSNAGFIFYVIVGIAVIGFFIHRLFSLSSVVDKLKKIFGTYKEDEFIDNHNEITILKYLRLKNKDAFYTACTYIQNRTYLPQHIHKELTEIIFKQGQYKKQDWITNNIRLVALHNLCSCVKKNIHLDEKGKPLTIDYKTCPQIDCHFQ